VISRRHSALLTSVLLIAATLLSPATSRSITLSEFIHSSTVPRLEVEILAQIPHNPMSFTQGLLFHDGYLYESTGLYGGSTLQKLNPQTGDTLIVDSLESSLFGEGISLCDGKIVQITWRESMALIHRLDDLKVVSAWQYPTEGWGLTTDGKRLIMTDGTPYMYFRSLTDFSLQGKITVRLQGQPIQALNELEYVKGTVYANILGEDWILEIDPESGNVTAAIDARSMREKIPEKEPPDPLNGIAFDATTGDFYLTGKLWPAIFRVRFVKSLGER
jgi:glutaminyl-peptide cyclotransferase